MITKPKLIILLILNLSLFSFAFGQTPRNQKKKNPSAKSVAEKSSLIKTVDFCDLTIHPKLYIGKLVRVKGSLVSWWESSYLYNVKCETDNRKIHDSLDCSDENECKTVGKRVYGIISRNQQLDKNKYAFRAYITLIGHLIGPRKTGFGHLNSFKFEFRIKKVEAVSPMPANIPYAEDKKGDLSQ